MGTKGNKRYNREKQRESRFKRGLSSAGHEAKRNERIKREHMPWQPIGPSDDLADIARMTANLHFRKHVKMFNKWKV